MKVHCRRDQRFYWLAIVGLGLLISACGGGSTDVSQPASGPELMTSPSSLSASLAYFPAEQPSDRLPVLLVHGTGSTPEENWGWNYVPVLTGLGIDVYTVALPQRALVDIQDSAEYLVYAIRHIADVTGQKLQIIGHSQGGLVPRWALKYWPDLRLLVDDLVTLGTPRDGTLQGNAVCVAGCGAAIWQVSYQSYLVQALNAGEPTPGDVSYTSIMSQTDEIAFPGVGLDPAPNVRNIFVQELCPGRVVDHIGLVVDAVAYAAVMDALENPGPLDPMRFDSRTCLQLNMPGVPDTALVTDGAAAGAGALLAILSAPRQYAEPPLRDYAR